MVGSRKWPPFRCRARKATEMWPSCLLSIHIAHGLAKPMRKRTIIQCMHALRVIAWAVGPVHGGMVM